MTDQLLSFVEKYLVVDDAKCSRHCSEKARFVPIDRTGSSIVVAYACPANYVSKVVYFADNPDPAWFEKFLSDRIGKIRSRDLRKATRHGWELGGQAEKEISKVSRSKALTQYYWAPYPQTDEEKKYGAFLCAKEDGGCGRLYTKLKSEESKLCPDCRKN